MLKTTWNQIAGTTLTNTMNEGKGELRNNDKPKQKRMLENDICIYRIRKDDIANIPLSFQRKNNLDDSCKDVEEKTSGGGNKGDKDDQF